MRDKTMDGRGSPTEGPGLSPARPTPQQCRVGFTMIPSGAGLAGQDGENTGADRQTAPPQTTCPDLPQPPHHTLGPGPGVPPAAPARSVQGKGNREGGEGTGLAGEVVTRSQSGR